MVNKMNKKFLIIILLISNINILNAHDFSISENFDPVLLTEVNFNKDMSIETDTTSYIVYKNKIYKNIYNKDQNIGYVFEYSDNCINFSKKADNVLSYLPNSCYITIELLINNEKIWQYICNNKQCKKFNIFIESMYEPEFGEDRSEETFNQTKAYDGSNFYDKIIEIK